MSSAEQRFYEGLKVLRPIFQDRTHVVGKQISAGLHVTTCGARAISGCRENEGNLFTYNVGPVLKYRSEHFEPFVETLFGGAHSNTYQNLLKACQANCTTTQNPSNNAFDFVIG